jgi:hypothetical protein
MNHPSKKSLLVGLLFFISNTTYGQYFGERVMEKSFEQTDFFFTPTPLMPYGVGGFRSISASLFEDPLSRLAVNPAFFSIDTLKDHYAYLDFRSVSEVRSQSTSYYYPMYDYLVARDVAYFPYPRYYLNTRKELEPVFSGAYLTRPLPSLLPRLLAGATYQAVFQDDKYYAIPQDIYRSVLGYDYTGARASAEDLPTVDRYKGNDNIHHIAHMFSFFAAYEVLNNLQVGAKLARTSFNRDGSYGSQNLWDGYYDPNYKSLWGNLESREQQYRDWDFSAGVRYRFGERDEIGLLFGRLWGNADQGLIRTDTSFYGSGLLGVGTDWSYYNRSGITDQSWNHNGGTTYGGIQLYRALSSSVTLSLLYGFNKQNMDIRLASSISDTSFSSYRYQYNDTSVSQSEGFSRLIDTRSGNGTKSSSVHRFFTSLHWSPHERANVTLGLQLEFQSSETKTDEGVFSRQQSQYSGLYEQWSYFSYDATLEQKHLLWTFTTDVTTLFIPIVFQWQATDWLDALVGISRTMSSWEINDVTLAVISVRDRQTTSGNEHKENFGERYTMPRERVSDVRTSALVGLTARPSTLFNIRLLVTPNIVDDYDGSHIQDLRWWLAFQLTP